jgi:prephenate dehydratase
MLTAYLGPPGSFTEAALASLEGHITQRPVRSAVAAVRRRAEGTIFLGSYPRARYPQPILTLPFRSRKPAPSVPPVRLR